MNSKSGEESLEIEVLRKARQSQTSSLINSTGVSTPDSSSSYGYQRRLKAGISSPTCGREREKVKNKLRNGCCHSTPILGSAANSMPLKDYFNKLSLPLTPIAPCAGIGPTFELQDATNIQPKRRVGKTLLELESTHQLSTMDRLLDFDEIGFETSDPGLAGGFTNLFDLDDTANSVEEKSIPRKTLCHNKNRPQCILAKLSKEKPKFSRRAQPRHKGVPEDILTRLHTYPDSKGRHVTIA